MTNSPAPPTSWRTNHDARGCLPIHRHATPYAALVLEGTYHELSVDGRYRCTPGTLVVHPAHHAHANEFGTSTVRVLNIPLPADVELGGYRVRHATDPVTLERLMTRDPQAAATAALGEPHALDAHEPEPWLGSMATKLRDLSSGNSGATVESISAELGKSAAHASRAFKRHFGVGPCAYRREYRLRLAVELVRCGRSIAGAAASAGFSDQSHFGRELKRATGRTALTFRD